MQQRLYMRHRALLALIYFMSSDERRLVAIAKDAISRLNEMIAHARRACGDLEIGRIYQRTSVIARG